MVAEKTILLLEDEPESAFFVRYILKRFGRGYRLVHFASGYAAMEYLKDESASNQCRLHPLPDLILLDLKLPDLDGFEFLAWLRSQPDLAGLPTCILTGSAYPPHRTRAEELGADAYVIKPADLSDFVGCLKDLLEKYCPQPEQRVQGMEITEPRRTAILAA